jgi:hypothetical protein
VYLTNGYDPVKVWDGVTASLQNAGIVGPVAAIGAPTAAAGGLSNGDHLIRYRYKKTGTGFVSNPSPALTYTVAGSNGVLTFDIGVGQDIIPSTDPKVDQYVIEVTPTGGGTFYQAMTVAVGTATAVIGMPDSSLIQQFNSDSEYGSSEDLETYSSSPPPLGTIFLSFRGRSWVIGDRPYPVTATFTSASKTVTGTGFNLNWAGMIIYKTADTARYEISSVTNSTTMTLAKPFVGGTGSSPATVASRFPNRGRYSRLFYPEQYYPAVWARDFLADKSDQVVAALGREEGLYVFGRTNTEVLIFNSDPSAAAGSVLSPCRGRRGVFSSRCLVDVEGELYAWDRQGVWMVGKTPRHVSGKIDALLSTMIDFSKSENFHAAYDPIARTAMFFFVAAGETQPKYAACYEMETGRWFMDSFLQGVTSSGVIPTRDGQVRMMLGDENGYTWFLGVENGWDGTPPSTSPIVTVLSSSSTTAFYVNQLLVNSALKGVVVYSPSTGERSICTANSDNQITVSPAFTAIPLVGAEFYLGPINFEYHTKHWVGAGQEARKNPAYFLLKLFPGSGTGTLRIYFYPDFATTPAQFTAQLADTQPDGVSITNGTFFAEVSLDGGSGDGVISIPVPVQWSNTIQARITSIRPDGALRILDATFLTSKPGIASDLGT